MNYQFAKELIQNLKKEQSIKIDFNSPNKIKSQITPWLRKIITDNSNLKELYILSTDQYLLAFFYIELDDTDAVVLIEPGSAHIPLQFLQLSEIVMLYRKNFFCDVTNIYKLITHKKPTAHFLTTRIRLSTHKEFQQNVVNYGEYYTLEKRLFAAVRSNDIDEVQWIFKKFKTERSVQLSVNQLQNIKFKSVALITLLARVSITKKVPIASAFDLSDKIIGLIDRTYSAESCSRLLEQAILSYMKLINNSSVSVQSKLINEVVLYVDQNIFDPLTLTEVSQALNKSASYVSRKFKQETGLSLHKFIIERKLQQAELMIELSDMSLLEISEKLYFSSQSHFSYLFKKMRGCRPSRLRTANNQLNIWETNNIK